MKFRLLMSLAVIIVLIVLVVMFEGNGDSGASYQSPSGFEDAKSFKIN